MVYVVVVVKEIMTGKCAGGIVIHHAGTKDMTVLIQLASLEAIYPVDISFSFVVCTG
jgi:hypothetical protein